MIAALRYWQADTDMDDRMAISIATDSESFAPLNDAEIDSLCEKLNTL